MSAALALGKSCGCELVKEAVQQFLKGEERGSEPRDCVDFMLDAISGATGEEESESLSSQLVAAALMDDNELSTGGTTGVFDAQGRWTYYSKHSFGAGKNATDYNVPHVLQLSAEDESGNREAVFDARGHVEGGSIRGRGRWSNRSDGSRLEVLLWSFDIEGIPPASIAFARAPTAAAAATTTPPSAQASTVVPGWDSERPRPDAQGGPRHAAKQGPEGISSGTEEQAGAGGRGGEEMEYVQLCIVRHGLGLAVDAGCVILEAGVEAAAAGVTVGARLASINGRMIADRSEFFEVLNGLKDGTTIVAGLVASARLVTAPPIVEPLFICTLPVTYLDIHEMH